MKNNHVAPILKWVGGKRQLLSEIRPLIPPYEKYYEPFIGGGALFFELQPAHALINDYNHELVNVYSTVKSDVMGLIKSLKNFSNTAEEFYRIRDIDRNVSEYRKLSNVERAARIIYLNKTCYNGLFRVNSQGHFNTPYGAYKQPNIVNEKTLIAVSDFLKSNDISFLTGDFALAVSTAKKGDFVYFDPPYDPLTSSASFTGYSETGFSKEDQIRLKKICDDLDSRGVKFLLSNSATDFIKDLYKDYTITIVKAKRSVNSIASKRGEIEEVLVRNY